MTTCMYQQRRHTAKDLTPKPAKTERLIWGGSKKVMRHNQREMYGWVMQNTQNCDAHGMDTDCHEWQGLFNKAGGSQLSWGWIISVVRFVAAHNIGARWGEYGRFDPLGNVTRKCKNRYCLNPDHLRFRFWWGGNSYDTYEEYNLVYRQWRYEFDRERKDDYKKDTLKAFILTAKLKREHWYPGHVVNPNIDEERTHCIECNEISWELDTVYDDEGYYCCAGCDRSSKNIKLFMVKNSQPRHDYLRNQRANGWRSYVKLYCGVCIEVHVMGDSYRSWWKVLGIYYGGPHEIKPLPEGEWRRRFKTGQVVSW